MLPCTTSSSVILVLTAPASRLPARLSSAYLLAVMGRPRALARGPGGRGLGRADYRDHPTAQYRLGRAWGGARAARVRAAGEVAEALLQHFKPPLCTKEINRLINKNPVAEKVVIPII